MLLQCFTVTTKTNNIDTPKLVFCDTTTSKNKSLEDIRKKLYTSASVTILYPFRRPSRGNIHPHPHVNGRGALANWSTRAIRLCNEITLSSPSPTAWGRHRKRIFFFFSEHTHFPISGRFGFFFALALWHLSLVWTVFFVGRRKNTSELVDNPYGWSNRIWFFPQNLSANTTVMLFLKVGSGPFGWGVYVFPLPKIPSKKRLKRRVWKWHYFFGIQDTAYFQGVRY